MPAGGRCDMSVAKIAAGVVIGNLVTALIFWLIMSVVLDSARTDALVDQANRQYEAMNATR